MAVTPRGIWTPDGVDGWDLTVDLAAMAVSIDTAITTATDVVHATVTALKATSPANGTQAIALNAPGATFIRTSGTWVQTGIPRFANIAAATAALVSPNANDLAMTDDAGLAIFSTAWRVVGPIGNVPFRVAAGTVSSGAAIGTQNITFPVGRFSVAPLVMVTPLNPASGAVAFYFTVSALTASGFTLAISNSGGFVTGVGFTWQAIQMTPTTAAG